jgi:3-methylcrotonyl-CoA carboxylase alpha subunit
VTVHYDPLLAKLVAFAETRDAAIARATTALQAYPILGIRTNVAFLAALVAHPSFRAGEVDTAFVDERIAELALSGPLPADVEAAARAYRPAGPAAVEPVAAVTAPADPWTTLTGWGR